MSDRFKGAFYWLESNCSSKTLSLISMVFSSSKFFMKNFLLIPRYSITSMGSFYLITAPLVLNNLSSFSFLIAYMAKSLS